MGLKAEAGICARIARRCPHDADGAQYVFKQAASITFRVSRLVWMLPERPETANDHAL